LIDRWKEQGIYEDIKNRLIHIIWTGGEPTIKGHQEAIVNFHKYWKSIDLSVDLTTAYYEIETNGTIYIEDALFKDLDQINCSPKLSNSGMTEKQRIVPVAIERIMEHRNYQFKFVKKCLKILLNHSISHFKEYVVCREWMLKNNSMKEPNGYLKWPKNINL
jgi:organic radical activating enzyme